MTHPGHWPIKSSKFIVRPVDRQCTLSSSPSHFARVTHLSLYFPSNFGNETTRVYYIGLRGEYLGVSIPSDTSDQSDGLLFE